MTENQKAATFIGWKDAGPMCQAWRGGAWSNTPRLRGPCPRCGIEIEWHQFTLLLMPAWGPVDHPAQAPDMSKPENYMRALEAVAEKGLYVYLNIYRAVGGPHFTGVWIKAEKHCDCANDMECTHDWPKIRASNINAEPGIAATKALVALYDATAPVSTKPR